MIDLWQARRNCARAATTATPGVVAWLLNAAMALVLAGCASQPSRPNDVCEVFAEKDDWYADAHRAAERWNSSVPLLMAFMHKESRFDPAARPARGKLLWVIPWTRPSSAYGYAQATDEAWSDYRADAGSRFADRDDFSDAVDFVGWYNDRSARALGIARSDAYHLYVAYHEGVSGYRSGAWRRKRHVMSYAEEVATRTRRFDSALLECADELRRGSSWWPF